MIISLYYTGNMQDIKQLTADRFKNAILTGVAHIIEKEEHLNDINVFPVPDGDTGTNLALTSEYVIDRISAQDYETVKLLLEDVADAALEGSRGNSGTIFSQFLQGLYEGADDGEYLEIPQFVRAFESGADFAYNSVSQPMLGTIISLAKGVPGVSIPTTSEHNILFGLVTWTSHNVEQLQGLVWMPWFQLWFFMIGGFYFGRMASK